jgi:hypothetical protein
MDIVLALKQLQKQGRVSDGWSCGDTIDSITLISTDLPLTEQEITEAYNKYIYYNDYKRKRADEYPSIVEQLDLLYHGGIDGWRASIKAIKDKYPKPE